MYSTSNEYEKVQDTKMNINKYKTSKWIIKSTVHQNEY